MIKNIPNKYSLKLLADEIDQEHADTYDFLYLPFDYNVISLLSQNNCNVGYAFINFLNPSFIKHFYECFNEKKWSKFKSLKVLAQFNIDLRAYVCEAAGSAESYRALLQLQGTQPEGKAVPSHHQGFLTAIRPARKAAPEQAIVTEFFNYNLTMKRTGLTGEGNQ